MSDFIELDKHTKKALNIFALIFGAFIIFIIAREYFFGYDESVKAMLAKEYIRKVDSVYVNKEEHNFRYVAYSGGKKGILEFEYQKGDSLVKKKGDSIEYIYRKDEIIPSNKLEIL
ncbi:MAG: hypothetical protein J6N74_03600, partial [Chryseobacterium sp.]|nr:hypothetical protein [Chryseobacterium sp.]